MSGQFSLSGGASLQLVAGSLGLTGGGTVSGSITGDGGLEFGGPSFTLSATSSVSAAVVYVLPGTVATEAGTYDVTDETYAYGNLTFTAPITDLGSSLLVGGAINLPGQSFSFTSLNNSGTIDGGGGTSLTVAGSMNWYYGTIMGFGTLDIASGATATLGFGCCGAPNVLSGVTLENAGAVTVGTGDGPYGYVLALENRAGLPTAKPPPVSRSANVHRTPHLGVLLPVTARRHSLPTKEFLSPAGGLQRCDHPSSRRLPTRPAAQLPC